MSEIGWTCLGCVGFVLAVSIFSGLALMIVVLNS